MDPKPWRGGPNGPFVTFMSEPQQARSTEASTSGRLLRQDAPVAPADALPAEIFVGNASDVSDDAPTIISKANPSPVKPENTLAGSLRGRNLAHFELLEPIGIGGMAAVLRARDRQL